MKHKTKRTKKHTHRLRDTSTPPESMRPTAGESKTPPNTLNKMYRHFDIKQLRHRCRQSITEIFNDVKASGGINVDTRNGRYAYKNNGASVLAVAHCDCVTHVNQQFGVLRIGGSTLIYSPQLDDRLGVYAILDVLPRLNIPVDILLTEGEESGKSTAQYFETRKKYKWMVEFDRRGDDVVTYLYGDRQWEKLLAQDFPRVGRGSFSDICKLPHLGCRGVNVGIGYVREHSNDCNMDLRTFLSQMANFRAFWWKHHKTHFEFVKQTRATSVSRTDSLWDAPRGFYGDGYYGDGYFGFGNNPGGGYIRHFEEEEEAPVRTAPLWTRPAGLRDLPEGTPAASDRCRKKNAEELGGKFLRSPVDLSKETPKGAPEKNPKKVPEKNPKKVPKETPGETLSGRVLRVFAASLKVLLAKSPPVSAALKCPACGNVIQVLEKNLVDQEHLLCSCGTVVRIRYKTPMDITTLIALDEEQGQKMKLARNFLAEHKKGDLL